MAGPLIPSGVKGSYSMPSTAKTLRTASGSCAFQAAMKSLTAVRAVPIVVVVCPWLMAFLLVIDRLIDTIAAIDAARNYAAGKWRAGLTCRGRATMIAARGGAHDRR